MKSTNVRAKEWTNELTDWAIEIVRQANNWSEFLATVDSVDAPETRRKLDALCRYANEIIKAEAERY